MPGNAPVCHIPGRFHRTVGLFLEMPLQCDDKTLICVAKLEKDHSSTVNKIMPDCFNVFFYGGILLRSIKLSAGNKRH